MAFVYKSEKGFENIVGDTGEIGPGEYLPQTDLKEIKISKEPFLTGEKRSKKIKDDYPGPGAYYQDEDLINYLKNIQNEKILKQNDKDVLIPGENGVINLKSNVEKLGFTTKEKRFKIINPSDTPAPGAYFPGEPQERPAKKENLREEIMKLRKVFTIKKDTIPSIPYHNQDFGFEINKNGELRKKENPEMYKTFTGEKGDTVGPGSYEIDVPSQWHKTGTEWSKFKTGRNEANGNYITKNATIYKGNVKETPFISLQSTRYSEGAFKLSKTQFGFGKNTKSTLDNSKNNSSMNTTSRDMKNIMNVRVKNCKVANNRKIKIVHNFENAIDKNYPGPGYYFDNRKASSFNPKVSPEYNQFFGSKLERFKTPKNNMSHLGPTTYFNNDDKENERSTQIAKEKMSRTTKNFAPFESRTNRFFILKSKDKFPGPGEYNVPHSFSYDDPKKVFSNTFSRFGSSEKRFVDDKNTKWHYATPGPGSYIDPYSATGIFNTVNYRGLIVDIEKAKSLSRPHNENLSVDIRSSKNRNDFVPPVGTYQGDMVYTIDYQNQKKQMKPYGKDVAFCSSKTKKEKKVTTNLGPGYYYKEKTVKKKQVFPPFKQSDRRKFNYVGEFLTGPGQYNLDSYFDWNKKSYNMNFV